VSEKESDPTARGGQPAPAGDGDPEIGIRQIRDSGEDQPMVAAKLVTLRRTNPSEMLLIAGLKQGRFLL
jgi:hypothetical protein